MGTTTYTADERSIHERHVNLMASCPLCVDEAGDQPDRLTREYSVSIDVPVVITIEAMSPTEALRLGEDAWITMADAMENALHAVSMGTSLSDLPPVTDVMLGTRYDEIVVDEIDPDTGQLLGTEYRRTRL